MDVLVAGDIVNGLANTAAIIYFQPAGTNTFCITCASAWGAYTKITNGVISGYVTATPANGGPFDAKVMINNTNYLEILGSANGQFYCGIQVE